jgi:6-phosphogluconolactonase
VYRVSGDGELQLDDELPMLPDGFAGSSFGADVVVTSTGRVFASNRGHDSVVSYEPTPPSGTKQSAAWWPTGSIPRGLALTPDERHLLVANQESDEVQVFALADDGSLQLALTLPVATPVCVKCVTP